MTLLFCLFLALPLYVVIISHSDIIVASKIENRPIITVKDFVFAQVDKNGTNRVVLGSLGYHFRSNDELYDMIFKQKTGNAVQSVSAKKAHKTGDIVYFDGNVNSDDGKGLFVKSQSAKYDTEQKRLDITSPFVATSNKYTIDGSGASLTNGGKKITAQNIKAIINMDK
jgi:hypothetical protein